MSIRESAASSVTRIRSPERGIAPGSVVCMGAPSLRGSVFGGNRLCYIIRKRLRLL
jgi:hypothetical protein